MKWLLLWALFSANSYARDVQLSECVGPADAPVTGVYLHGLFPPKGAADDFYLNLENDNRTKLTDLANALHIRIAIPVCPTVNKSGYRDWRAGKSTDDTFDNLQKDAEKVCGSALSAPRALIGFSEGGYYTRDVALECNTSMLSGYSTLIMSGAKAIVPAAAAKKGCTYLVAATGDKDTSTSTCYVDKNKHTHCTSFLTMAARMKKLYPSMEARTYPGAHVVPTADLLTEFLPAK